MDDQTARLSLELALHLKRWQKEHAPDMCQFLAALKIICDSLCEAHIKEYHSAELDELNEQAKKASMN